MEAKNLNIVSWKFENFGCWNLVLHGICIETPLIGFEQCQFKMRLYPRGISGLEKHMDVYLSVIERKNEFSGDLSFMDAGGSTLFMQRVYSKEDAKDFELSKGPKFEKVIAQIGENKIDKNDQFTLRFQMKSENKYDENFVYTKINVFDVTLEVDCGEIKEDNTISCVRYLHDDQHHQIHLKTSQIGGDKKVLYLKPYVDDTFSYSVQTHLRLLSSVGSVISSEKKEHVFHGNKPWTVWTSSDSLSKKEPSEKARSLILDLKIISGKVNHTLQNVYLECDNAKILPNLSKSICEEKPRKIRNDQENAADVLSKELMCLYQDQDFSDLQLKCGSVSFPVHKAILSARSTVFNIMLSTDMTEAATGCVNIEDLDVATLARFLAFLYAGAVEDLQVESALKLYYAADKYHVPSLKTECVELLSSNVSFSNVCDVLLLGDKHQDGELTAIAHDFILRNFNEFLKSKKWNSFMSREPLLGVKTLTSFAEKDFVVANLNAL